MIACSGIDRAGKTTLACYLRDTCGRSLRHFTRPPLPTYRYLMLQLADTHPRMVLDRLGHFDELVYGPVYRSQMTLTSHQWRLIELTLLTLGCVVVNLTDSPEGIKSRWGDDEMWPSWGIEAIQEGFAALAQGTSWPKSHLPISTWTLPELLRGGKPTEALAEVVQLAQDRERAAALLPPPSLFLGSADAEFLVIGEAPAPGGPLKDAQGSDPDLPFSRGPASEWLWRAFDEVGLHWWRGAYCNAATFDSSASLWWWFRALRPHLSAVRQVVCLGERAAKFVHEQQRDGWRVSCTHVWHPSYVRQFRHREYPEWRDALTVALADWCEGAHLALERGGYPDGGGEIEPHRPGSGPAPAVAEPLAPDEKARTCVSCRGRGFEQTEGASIGSDFVTCAACAGRGYSIRIAS